MRKERMLIAGINKSFIHLTVKALEKRFDIYLATSYQEVLDIARHEMPDIIIIGMLSPMEDAFALHKQLKAIARTKDIPVVIIDEPTHGDHRRGWLKGEGLQMEAEAYLTLPVKPETLYKEVDLCLERKLNRKKQEMENALEQTKKYLIDQIKEWTRNVEKLVSAVRG